MSIPETPYTRLEMYLDEIARNGGGGGGGGGSSSLSGLTDVDISNPTDGQTLVYNATSGKWENGESAGGGVLVCTLNMQTMSIDHTWQEIHDASFAVLRVPSGPGLDIVSYAYALLYENGEYSIRFVNFSNDPSTPVMILTAIASSANDYPVVQLDP